MGRASPDALDRVIDELLNRPAYGERWARHWLDVVRYADSNGYERDAEKLNAAVLAGWRVLRFTTGMVRQGAAETIRAAIERRREA